MARAGLRGFLPGFRSPPPINPRARACSIRAWDDATMEVIAGHACSVAELIVPSIFRISSTQAWKSEARMAPLGVSP